MMNQRLTALILIVLFLGSIFLSNCSDSTSSEKETLIGTWELTQVKYKYTIYTVNFDPEDLDLAITLIIRDDNTYTVIQTEEGETITETGTWSTSGNKLTIVEDSYTDEVEFNLDGDKLEITFEEQSGDETITVTQIFTKQ